MKKWQWDTLQLRHCLHELTKIVGHYAGNVLFPPICVGCRVIVSQTGTICPQCWSQLQFITQPFCPILGIPHSFYTTEELISNQALNDPPPFGRARAVLIHNGLTRKLVSRLKFSDQTELAPWMAKWMCIAGQDIINNKDYIIPIPLHAMRFLQRGYNQSAELARNIAKLQKIPFYPEGLTRSKNTQPQVGLSLAARQNNVRGAFHVPEKYRGKLINKRILLIDDVFTTGSTVRAASKTLLDAGVSEVDVLTFSHRLQKDLSLKHYPKSMLKFSKKKTSAHKQPH